MVFCGSEAIAGDESTSRLNFDIKPRICVLAQGEEYCQDAILARWSTKNKKTVSVCLYQGEVEEPLTCWENHRSGVYKISVQTRESLVFTLKQSMNNRLLVEKVFEVHHDSKRYRRSRRNPWSFF